MALNQVMYMETAAIVQPPDIMTPDANATIFQASYTNFAASAGDPLVQPYGVESGCLIEPTANNDEVKVNAGVVSMADKGFSDANGRVNVAEATLSGLARPSASNVIIHAIVAQGTDGTAAIVAGTENTEFVNAYGVPGGAPYIAVDAVCLGHIYLDSDGAAVIQAGEIHQFPDAQNEPVSQEQAAFPTWKEPIDNLEKSVQGQVEFTRAIPKMHTGDLPKQVVLNAATAVMTRLGNVSTYTPTESTYSSTSTDTYDGPISQQSASLTNGTFEIAAMKDGVSDAVVAMKGKRVLCQYFNDEFTPDRYIVDQGQVQLSRTFAASQDPTGTITIAARSAAVEVTP